MESAVCSIGPGLDLSVEVTTQPLLFNLSTVHVCIILSCLYIDTHETLGSDYREIFCRVHSRQLRSMRDTMMPISNSCQRRGFFVLGNISR